MLIYLLVLHFIGDFILQSREVGKRKSTEFRFLFKHMSIYYLVFMVGLIPIFHGKETYFNILNVLIHGLIDWNIWKLYKLDVLTRLGVSHMNLEAVDVKQLIADFKYWEDNRFYITIGFDQLLHTSTIVLLHRWLL